LLSRTIGTNNAPVPDRPVVDVAFIINRVRPVIRNGLVEATHG
jgi:hypothetical protein